MKKKILLLVAMIAVMIFVFAISASAAEKVGDFYYSFNEADLTARLTIDNVNFNREDGIADIKSTVEYKEKTYTVVALDDGCFSGSTSNTWPGNKSIKEVYIPETVTYIGKHAFRECINLEKSVENFVKNQTDVTINGIETPIQKYVNYISPVSFGPSPLIYNTASVNAATLSAAEKNVFPLWMKR